VAEPVREIVLRRIAEGESLRSIAKDEGMPAPSTVCLWAAADPTFAEQYARAREAQMDRYAEEILEISDDSTNDYMEKQNKDGSTYGAFNGEHIQRSRLRVDSRKWLMSKLAPKKYGEKVQIGGDPERPFQIENVTNLERAKALAALVHKTKEVA
jgi:hypothetical protein